MLVLILQLSPARARCAYLESDPTMLMFEVLTLRRPVLLYAACGVTERCLQGLQEGKEELEVSSCVWCVLPYLFMSVGCVC